MRRICTICSHRPLFGSVCGPRPLGLADGGFSTLLSRQIHLDAGALHERLQALASASARRPQAHIGEAPRAAYNVGTVASGTDPRLAGLEVRYKIGGR